MAEIPFNEYSSIWTEQELSLKFTTLEMIDPFTDEAKEVVKTNKIVGGYPFDLLLMYELPHPSYANNGYFPFREQTGFEVEFLENGRMRLVRTPLQFAIAPSSNPNPGTDVEGRAGTFVYKLKFSNAQQASGLFTVQDNGDVTRKRLLVSGKASIQLPNDPKLLAPTQIMFQKTA